MINNINGNILSLSTILILGLSGCNSSSSDSDCTRSTSETENNSTAHNVVSDEVIAEQRKILAESIKGKNPVAQAPRDIDSVSGDNTNIAENHAPKYEEMYLCDIHFHKSAEHKGGEFTKYAGNGNGEGYGSGYQYTGTLTQEELAPYDIENEHNPLHSGDTIEVHYVYSDNAKATLGNGLKTCFGDVAEGTQPVLRVEARVYALVNDEKALDFTTLTKVTNVDGHNQSSDLSRNPGTPVVYEGSTTGPGYNEKVSPYQVTWSVRPTVTKVNIQTVDEWLHDNEFEEEHAHGVRNVLINPALLSEIVTP